MTTFGSSCLNHSGTPRFPVCALHYSCHSCDSWFPESFRHATIFSLRRSTNRTPRWFEYTHELVCIGWAMQRTGVAWLSPLGYTRQVGAHPRVGGAVGREETGMSNRPVRFIHAADFHLEQPPSGVAVVPGHLRDLFLESAWLAAQRVFEAVLSEEAEFLVLSGDLLDPLKTGPRGPLFLVEQFQRLAERGIPVYWAAGRVDPPELWPATIPLPENVCLFPGGQPAVFNYQRDGVPVVRVVGASRVRGRKVRAGEFEPDPAGLYTIGVVHGNAEAESLRARKIDYWALGGSHTRNTLFSSPAVAHYPGTIQGRRPDQCGAHGCTLVQADENRKTRTTLIPCDALRWQTEQVVVDPRTTREELEPWLRDRVHKLERGGMRPGPLDFLDGRRQRTVVGPIAARQSGLGTARRAATRIRHAISGRVERLVPG